MGKKDNPTKSYMMDNAHFADAFNVALFGGKKKIKPEDLTERDPVEIGLLSASATPGKTTVSVQKVRDVMKQVVVRDDKTTRYILLGIENQSDVHYAMPVKCLVYDALNYIGQVEDIAEKHRKFIDCNENSKADFDRSGKKEKAEFVSGFTSNDRILPVITLVVYWGSEDWDGPRSLHEMFQDVPKQYLKHIPDYHLNLLIPREIGDMNKFSTMLGTVLRLLAATSDKDKLEQLVASNPELYENLPITEVRLINELTNLKIRKTRGKESGDVCKAIEELKEEATVKERKKNIHILVESLREVGQTTAEIAKKIQEKYGLSAKDVATFL